MVVEHLSLYGGDGREGKGISLPTTGLLDDSSDLCLMDTGAHRAIGCQVHTGGHIHGIIQDTQLFLVLIDTLGNDRFDHLFRNLSRLLCRVEAEQLP